MSLESVIRKVQALRDLAARAGTIHEAQAAAAQADALLQKHRLTEAEIEASGCVVAEGIVDDDRPVVDGKRLDSWRTRLAATVAEHYGCVAHSTRRYQGGHQASVELKIAGRPSDIEIVRYMFAWLSAEVTRLAAREPAGARHLFKHGAVTGVDETLVAARRRADAEHTKAHGGSVALAVAHRAKATREWMRGVNPDMGEGCKAILRGSRSDYERGIDAGHRINLGPALPGAVRALPVST